MRQPLFLALAVALCLLAGACTSSHPDTYTNVTASTGAGKTVTGADLVAAGLLSRVRDGVRLLGKGELKTKLTIEVAGASKSAVAAVEKLGGSVIVKAPKPKKEETKAKA